jgi:hypothetical protein
MSVSATQTKGTVTGALALRRETLFR